MIALRVGYEDAARAGPHASFQLAFRTGLHVFVPVVRTLHFDAVRSISQAVSEHLRRRHPKEITTDGAPGM